MTDTNMSQDLVLATVAEVVPSIQDIPEEKVTAIQTQASDLVAKIVADPKDRALSDQVRYLGSRTEQRAHERMQLLEVRIADDVKMYKSGEARGKDKMVQLREKMDLLNPKKMDPPNLFEQILSNIPVLRRFAAVNAMHRYAMKYETYQDSLERSLNDYQEGAEDLLRDNIDLERAMDATVQDQIEVRNNAYLAEATLAELQKAFETTSDPEVKKALLSYLYHLSIRARDLRGTEAAQELMIDSLNTTRDTNLATYDNMKRVIGPVRNILQISIMNSIALDRQREAIEATQYLQDYATEMLTDTVKQAGQQKVQIAEMRAKPIFAMASIEEAFADAERSAIAANKIILETIPQAQAQGQKFLQLAEANRQRREGVALPESPSVNSIEVA